MEFLLMLALLLIFIQDYWYRAVYWFLFPFLFVLGIYLNQSLYIYSILAINFLIVGVLLLSLFLYVSFKKMKFTNISQSYFALGDMLMLLALTPFFMPYYFIQFISLGSVLSLLIYVLTRLLLKHSKYVKQSIPFAGNLALFFAAIQVFEFFFHLDFRGYGR
jgi:hypothetical protein